MTPTNLFAKKGWLTPLGLLGGHTGGGHGRGYGHWTFLISDEKMKKMRNMRKYPPGYVKNHSS